MANVEKHYHGVARFQCEINDPRCPICSAKEGENFQSLKDQIVVRPVAGKDDLVYAIDNLTTGENLAMVLVTHVNFQVLVEKFLEVKRG